MVFVPPPIERTASPGRSQPAKTRRKKKQPKAPVLRSPGVRKLGELLVPGAPSSSKRLRLPVATCSAREDASGPSYGMWGAGTWHLEPARERSPRRPRPKPALPPVPILTFYDRDRPWKAQALQRPPPSPARKRGKRRSPVGSTELPISPGPRGQPRSAATGDGSSPDSERGLGSGRRMLSPPPLPRQPLSPGHGAFSIGMPIRSRVRNMLPKVPADFWEDPSNVEHVTVTGLEPRAYMRVYPQFAPARHDSIWRSSLTVAPTAPALDRGSCIQTFGRACGRSTTWRAC